MLKKEEEKEGMREESMDTFLELPEMHKMHFFILIKIFKRN